MIEHKINFHSQDLGGFQRSSAAVENWLALQQHVEGFSLNARRVARRLAHFVSMLNQARLPDGYSQILRLYVFGPSGLKDYGSAALRCKI